MYLIFFMLQKMKPEFELILLDGSDCLFSTLKLHVPDVKFPFMLFASFKNFIYKIFYYYIYTTLCFILMGYGNMFTQSYNHEGIITPSL